MGNLFGGGQSNASSSSASTTAVEDPRAMPDPYSPIARRTEQRKRAAVSTRSGRVSTDLTRSMRRRSSDDLMNSVALGN